jgi:hypothetical protein
VQSVYARVVGLMVDFLSSTEVRVLIKQETYINREKRLLGARRLQVPNVPDYIVVTVSPTDNWSSHAYLYESLKSSLVSSGLTVEDVLESPPEPPAPTETSPTEPAPEPAPTEPAPEPAPTESTPEPAPEPTPEPEVSQQSSESTQ